MSYVEQAPTNTLETGAITKHACPSTLDFVRETLGMPEDFASPVDFLLPVEAHGLAPLLYQDIRRRGLEHQFDGAVLDRLRAEYLRSTAAHAVFSNELENVLATLEKVGIIPIVMKGLHLAKSFYEHGGLRSMGDIDLLVRPEEFERARAAMPLAGYHLGGETLYGVLDSNRTGFHYFKGKPPGWICVELHNAPIHGQNPGNYSKFDVGEMFERAQRIKFGDATGLGMGPADLLLFLCNHYRFHYFERLLWLFDIALVWQRCDPSLDKQALVEYARQLKLSTTLYYCLGFIRDLLGIPVDQSLMETLRPAYLPRKLVPRLFGTRGYRTLGAFEYRPLRVALQHLMVQRNSDFVPLAARLLFPTTANLGSLYVGDSALRLRFVRLFYLVHPFKVLAIGIKGLHVLTRRKAKTDPAVKSSKRRK